VNLNSDDTALKNHVKMDDSKIKSLEKEEKDNKDKEAKDYKKLDDEEI